MIVEIVDVAVLVFIIVYHLALLRYQPYSQQVSLHSDGALFYTFVVSGITQASLVAATLVFTTSDEGGMSTQAKLMEAFVLSILVFWLLLVVWLVYQYRPRMPACRRSQDDSNRQDEEDHLTAKTQHVEHLAFVECPLLKKAQV